MYYWLFFTFLPHCPGLFLLLQCGGNTQIRKRNSGTSLVAHHLRLHASNAEGTGSIPTQGTEIPQATRCGQKIFKKRNRNSGLSGQRNVKCCGFPKIPVLCSAEEWGHYRRVRKNISQIHPPPPFYTGNGVICRHQALFLQKLSQKPKGRKWEIWYFLKFAIELCT